MVDAIESSQLEPSGTEDKANPQQSSTIAWGLSMLCLFVMLVFLVGAIVVLTQHGKPDDGEEPARDENGGNNNGPSGPSSLPVNPVFTRADTGTTDSVSKTPESSGGSVIDPNPTPPSAKSTTTTAATTTTTTTTLRPKMTYTGPTVKPGLFVCYTLMHLWPLVETLEDGLCDLVIADEGCALAARFEDFPDKHKSFFDRSKNAVKTKYGIVVCSYDPDDFYDYYKSKDAITAMYQNNMRHFGFTNLGKETDQMTAAAFTIARTVITEMFGGVGTTVFVPYNTTYTTYQRLAHIASRTAVPDLMIIPGHQIEPSRNLTDRSLLPAINLYRPSTVYYRANYGRTLADAAEESFELVRLGLAKQIILVLTFGASSERMLYPDNLNDNLGRYAIYQPAVFPHNVSTNKLRRCFVDPRTVCNASDPEYLRNMQYQENAATWVTYNKGRRIERSYTLDTAVTFRFKMCNFFVNYTSVKARIHWGVTDLDYDAYDVNCRAFQLKAFERIKMLKAIRDFVYKDYWDPSDLYFCLRVTP